MRLVRVHRLLAFFNLCAGTSATLSTSRRQIIPSFQGPNVVPNTVFVEFDSQYAASLQDLTKSLDSSNYDGRVHREFHTFLTETHQIAFQPRHQFTNPDLILGTSLKLNDPADLHKLLQYPGVKQIHPIRTNHPSQPLSWGADQLASSVTVPPETTPLIGRSANKQSNSFSTDVCPDRSHEHRSIRTFGDSTYRMIGADRLHAQGYLGEGQYIAVIDSGVDFTHHGLNGGKPDGTACFGRGCPVVKGASFVNDTGDVVQGPSPFAACLGGVHGTFVSSLLIGNAPERNFTGIVPKATIGVYRVFGCMPSDVPDDTIMDAMQQAYEDGASIINMSLGRSDGWTFGSVTTALANKLAEQGVHVVVAVGNLGRYGAFQTETPSNAVNVYSVASVQNDVLRGYTARITGDGVDKEIFYLAANPIKYNETSSFSLYATSYEDDPKSDACGPLPPSTPDLTHSAVLISQGRTCGVGPQRNAAMHKGARIIISHSPSYTSLLSSPEYNGYGIQVIGLTHVVAMDIKRMLQAGKKLSIDFQGAQPRLMPYNQYGRAPSNFSELGPTWDLYAGVNMVAPGGLAFGLWPVPEGGFAIADGTSNASPLVAGSIALYRSIKGNTETPLELRRIFATTATPAVADPSAGVLDSVARSGNGLINVYNAVHSISRASTHHFALNDSRHFQPLHFVTVKNVGTSSQKFVMKHVPAGTIHALDGSEELRFQRGPISPVNSQQASLAFMPPTFTLQPGASRKVAVRIAPPAVDQRNLPIFSGFAVAQSDDPRGTLSISYLGVAADMFAYPVFKQDQPPGMYYNDTLVDQNGLKVVLRDDVPLEIRYWLLVGTVVEESWLVHANTTFIPTLPTFPDRPNDPPGTTENPAPLRQEDIVAQLEESRLYDRSLGDPQIQDYGSTTIGPHIFDVRYTDGTEEAREVPPGEYRILVRMLRVFGDERRESSFQSYLSPSFTVVKA